MSKSQDYLPDNALEQDEKDAHQAVMDRFDLMRTHWSPIHALAMEDDKFIAGQQWPDHIIKDRQEAGRPAMVYNLFPAFVRQITNKVRQERPQIRVKPVESDRGQTPSIQNVQGVKDYSYADVYMGIIRNIEHTSRAHQAYDTALQHSVNHGFGYWHLVTEYSRHDPFVQDFRIKRIRNSYSVMIDPSAQAADLSDAQDAFLFSYLNKAAFEAKYPGKQPTSSDFGGEGTSYDGNHDPDAVRIATYYWVDHVDDEVIKMSNGKVHYLSLVEDGLDEVKEQTGVHIARGPDGKELRRKVKRPVVKWRKLSGIEFLTPATETVFERIPIYAVLGEELLLNGEVIYKSAIRDAKDAQRTYNYWKSAMIEALALQPRSPWLATEEQLAGHEHLYQNANKQNVPAMIYNHIDGHPPPQRVHPPAPAAAEISAAGTDANDMMQIIGLHEADLGAPSNEKSGKAILARQAKGSTSTYHHPAALERAMEAMGRDIVQAIPRVIDTARMMRVRMVDDTEDFVELNKMVLDEETGKQVLMHDIAYGKYDVVIETGPSYATQRQEAVESMLELLRVLPEQVVASVVHLIVKEMGFPGADKVAEILRKTIPDEFKSEEDRAKDLPKGVVFNDQGQPVHEESGEPWQPPPTPETIELQKANRLKERELEADMQKHQATIAKAEADKAEAEADMMKLQVAGEAPQEVDNGPLISELGEMMKRSLEEHENDGGAHLEAMREVVTKAVAEALRHSKHYMDRTFQPKTNGAEEAQT